jgi:hypothetical protein
MLETIVTDLCIGTFIREHGDQIESLNIVSDEFEENTVIGNSSATLLDLEKLLTAILTVIFWLATIIRHAIMDFETDNKRLMNIL